MTSPIEILEGEAARIGAEIEHLEGVELRLENALEETDHQARRCRDGIERAGGVSRDLESELGMLDENRGLILDDLRKNHDQLVGLKKHLADIKEEISRLQGH